MDEPDNSKDFESGSFEPVCTILDWHDGPVTGVAFFRGSPHVYRLVFDEVVDEYSHGRYLLMPITQEVFNLAMEDWSLWLKWSRAFHRGTHTDVDLMGCHPVLPEDRARHEQIAREIGDRLALNPSHAFPAMAEFRKITRNQELPSEDLGTVKWTRA